MCLDRIETAPLGTVSYKYDAAGRRLTMHATSQPRVSYPWITIG